MRKIISLLVIAAVFISTGALSFAQEQKKIESKVGQNLVIALDSNKSTGFEWQMEIVGPAGRLRFINSEYRLKYPRMIGQGGEEIWSFRALSAGSLRIHFKYRRPWEKNVKPAKEVVYTVIVKP